MTREDVITEAKDRFFEGVPVPILLCLFINPGVFFMDDENYGKARNHRSFEPTVEYVAVCAPGMIQGIVMVPRLPYLASEQKGF